VNSLLRFTTSAVHEHVDHVSVIFGITMGYYSYHLLLLLFPSFAIVEASFTMVEP
jgi:hypothetical protein